MNKPRRQVAMIGKVTDAATGRQIEGADVKIAGPVVAKTRTAADGVFHFAGLPAGRYQVTASQPDEGNRYASGEGSADVAYDKSGGARIKGVEIALAGTTVKGKVTLTGHKTGLILAEVRVKGSGERTFSDAQGLYVLTGIEPGRRTVTVSALGCKPALQSVNLEGPGASHTVNFVLLAETG